MTLFSKSSWPSCNRSPLRDETKRSGGETLPPHRRLWAAKTSMEHFAMREPLNQDWMYDELANLGYPCFAHYRVGTPTYTPARFLAHVLDLPKVEPRVVAALPWLVYAFPLMEWDWL